MDNGLETTLVLYGQVAIGEYVPQTAEWTYYLGDNQLSVRQLVDAAETVTKVQTYGPYGVLLHQAGDGSGLFGYKGGQSAANGLWYFGGGYFDPATGQFLSANGNPLLPMASTAMAHPGGFLFGPILFVSWRRRKDKKHIDPATFLFFGILLAASLSACKQNNIQVTTSPDPTATPDPTGTPTEPPATEEPPPTGTTPPMPDPTDEPTPTITPSPTEDCTPEPPTPTATPSFPLSAAPGGVRNSTFTKYKQLWESLPDNIDPKNMSLNDEVVIAVIIWAELKSISPSEDPDATTAWEEAIEAVSFQYSSYKYSYRNAIELETCEGECDTIEKEMRWLDDFSAFYNGDVILMVAGWKNYAGIGESIDNLPTATDPNQGSLPGSTVNRNSHVWGNYTPTNIDSEKTLMQIYIEL